MRNRVLYDVRNPSKKQVRQSLAFYEQLGIEVAKEVEDMTVIEKASALSMLFDLSRTRSAEGMIDELTGFYDKDMLVDRMLLFFIKRMKRIDKPEPKNPNRHFWVVELLVEGDIPCTISLGGDDSRDALAAKVNEVPDSPVGPFLMERRPSKSENDYYGLHAVSASELPGIFAERSLDKPF